MRASSPDSDYDDYFTNLKKKTTGNSNDFHIEGLSDISFSDLSDKKDIKPATKSKFIKELKNEKVTDDSKINKPIKPINNKKSHHKEKNVGSKKSKSKTVEKKPKIEFHDSDPNFSLSSLSTTPRPTKLSSSVPKLQLSQLQKGQLSDDEESHFGKDGGRFFKSKALPAKEPPSSHRDSSPRKSTLRSARTPPSNKKVTIADNTAAKGFEGHTLSDKYGIASSDSISEEDVNFRGQMIMSLDDLGNDDEVVEEHIEDIPESECISHSSIGEKIMSIGDLVNEDTFNQQSALKVVKESSDDDSLTEIKTVPSTTPRMSLGPYKDQSISEVITVPGTARSSFSKQYSIEFEESVSKEKRHSKSRSKKSTRSYSSDFTKEESSTKSESVPSSIKRKPIKEKSTKHQGGDREKKANSTPYVHPLFGMGSIDPPTIAQYIVSPEVLESMTAYSPCMILLTNMMRQQLQMTTSFIENQKRLYEAIISSIKPTYNYCTLGDTKEFIRMNRKKSLSTAESLTDGQDG